MLGELLTAGDLARAYAVTVRCATRWAARGLLPGAYQTIVNGRATWLIPREALAGFVPPRPGRPPGAKRK